MSAKEIADAQRRASIAHHEARMRWLNSDAPVYACGTPVPRHEQTEMRNSSRDALRLMIDHGCSLNDCNCVPPCGAATGDSNG